MDQVDQRVVQMWKKFVSFFFGVPGSIIMILEIKLYNQTLF